MEGINVVNRGTVATVPLRQVDLPAASYDYSTTIDLRTRQKQKRKTDSQLATTSPRLTCSQDEERFKMIDDMRQFIRQHFHRKECSRFIPLPNQNVSKVRFLKCHCGGLLMRHLAFREKSVAAMMEIFIIPKELQWFLNRKRLDEPPSARMPVLQWNPSSIQKTVTNTYGKVNFVNIEHVGGNKPAKYIRITDDDSVDDLLQLMNDYWHIMQPKSPNLVISVVGGAKNFKLDGRMRDTFATGLIKAAKTTSAWMITSGFNMGVMKAVGQAVKQGQSFCWDYDRMAHVLRCIGIAPWGYVESRTQLESDDGEGLFNADFVASKAILHGEPVPLNPDHTHFIFVDDGYRNRYGGVAAMRARLEQKISQPQSEGGLGIPVVLIVVEGGTDAISDAKKSLEHKIPVVVCAGTGRAADILAYAYNHTKSVAGGGREMSLKNINKLKDKIVEAYGKSWKDEEVEKKVGTILEAVQTCCQLPEMMTVFHMNKHEDLDLAILSLLLKSHSGEYRNDVQLRLALMWDRVDIAQKEIFREDVLWKQGSLDDILMQAIMTDRLKFVELILQQGCVSMKDFLTMEKLDSLYKQVPPFHHIYQILFKLTSKSVLTVQNAHQLLCKLLDRFDMSSEHILDEYAEIETIGMKDVRFEHPYKHLMIWAILNHRQNLAKYCWEMGEEPVTSAVAATRLYGALSRHMSRHDSDIREKMIEYKNEFESLATNVLDECQHNDPNKTMMIVERKSRVWDEMTCLQIASASGDQKFLSTLGCQESIMASWKQGILSGYKMIMLAAIFPVLIHFFIEITNIGREALSWKQKLATFYSSPIVKFVLGTLLYVIFMFLHAYMVLVEFSPGSIKPLEVICVLWVLTYAVDKLHVFLCFPAPSLTSKFRDWYGLIKWMEVVNYFMCFIGFLLHWIFREWRTAKIIYCLNSALFLITYMKAYTTSSKSGPKLVMIKRMMGELKMFIMIIIVFLLAYGVSSQALMYSKRSASWTILKDVVYFPYWSLFGEIYLDEIQTDDCVPGDVDCRTFHWLVPFLLAFYLMAGNILLLNLLIAIFSNVFEQIDKNSIEIWKYEMYFLVMEHDCKTILVPPFSIVAHVFLLGQWIYHRCCCQPPGRKQLLGRRHLDYLQLFEKEMMTNCLRHSRAMQTSGLSSYISNLEKRVDALGKMVEDELLDDQHLQTQYFTTTMVPTLDRQATLNRDPSLLSMIPTWPPVATVLSVKEDVDKSEIPHDTFKLNKNRVHPEGAQDASVTPVPDKTSTEGAQKQNYINVNTEQKDQTVEVQEADAQQVEVADTHKKQKKEKKKKKKHKSKERKNEKEEAEMRQNDVNVPHSLAADTGMMSSYEDKPSGLFYPGQQNYTEVPNTSNINVQPAPGSSGGAYSKRWEAGPDVARQQEYRSMSRLTSKPPVGGRCSPMPSREEVLVSGDEGIMEEVEATPRRSKRFVLTDSASSDSEVSSRRRVFSKMMKKKKKKSRQRDWSLSDSDV